MNRGRVFLTALLASPVVYWTAVWFSPPPLRAALLLALLSGMTWLGVQGATAPIIEDDYEFGSTE